MFVLEFWLEEDEKWYFWGKWSDKDKAHDAMVRLAAMRSEPLRVRFVPEA